MALIVYLGVISLAVPIALAQAFNAEVRYLAPVLPLCVGIGILAVWAMQALAPMVRNIMLGFAVGSMLVMPGPDLRPVLGSTPMLYYRELLHPQTESYTPVIDWINAYVRPGQSIYVQPGYKTYPLMFRAPGPVYAWQLPDPPRDDFTGLPPIHFEGRVAPDYMIAFGPGSTNQKIPEAIAELAARGIHYHLIETLHYICKDLYRPERIWRSFVTNPPRPGEEIYVYQRVDR
jgi:hypothetical protein